MSQTSSGGGGVPARRAVVRWAWRMFRREWRQQVLVLALLTVAVAAAIAVASAAYNVAPSSGASEFGTANHFVDLDTSDPVKLASTVEAAQAWFGTIDVIRHSSAVVPGAVEQLDYRDQDPDGPYGDPMLDLRSGRYPATLNEVAMTDGAAALTGLGLGSTLELDGVARVVVGIVEDPSQLSDEFALVTPGSLVKVDAATMLIDASESRVMDFMNPSRGIHGIGARADVPENVIAAIGVFVISAIALFLIALVAAASFVVLAQRRQRQLGMLSALGATERHLRLVMVASGAAVGAVAAVVGAIIGVAGWIVAAPHLEQPLGFRIESVNVPWWLIAIGMAMAMATAIGSAWWPARAAARVPAVVALSGRPPRPAAVHRSAGAAVAFLAAGIGCLLAAGDLTGDRNVTTGSVLLVAGGTIGTVVGVLLISPLAVRVMAKVASHFPIAIRLPLRDLGRYQARSGLALAVISLVLGVPVAVIATAAAAESSASAGNLSSQQLLVRSADLDGPFAPLAANVAALQTGADQIAAAIPGSIITPLEAAHDPTAPTGDRPGREVVNLGKQRDAHSFGIVSMVYVATPELLDVYGVDLDSAEVDSGFLSTASTGTLALLGIGAQQGPRPEPQELTDPYPLTEHYTSMPGTFVTTAELERRGWEAVPAGRWLIQTSAPLTDSQLSTARKLAAAAGLTIESRDTQHGLSTLRNSATAIGIALALGILAMTVGLIRAEAAGDVRTLTATGASSSTRRTLAAATAGGLALLGAVLGVVGAYAALAAGPFGKVSRLSHVPFTQIGLIALGTPIIAAGAGWLLAGREPNTLSRRPVV